MIIKKDFPQIGACVCNAALRRVACSSPSLAFAAADEGPQGWREYTISGKKRGKNCQVLFSPSVLVWSVLSRLYTGVNHRFAE